MALRYPVTDSLSTVTVSLGTSLWWSVSLVEKLQSPISVIQHMLERLFLVSPSALKPILSGDISGDMPLVLDVPPPTHGFS
jgi:hypothetical protein